MALVPVAAVLVVLVVVVLASRSIVRVDGEVRALIVRGEVDAVLGSGIHVVPPFRSATYPIDPDAMTIELGGRRRPVPPEFRDDVRSAGSR